MSTVSKNLGDCKIPLDILTAMWDTKYMEPTKILTYHYSGVNFSLWSLKWTSDNDVFESFMIFDGNAFDHTKFVFAFKNMPSYHEAISKIEGYEFGGN